MTLPAFVANAAVPVTTGALVLAQQQEPGDGGGQGEDFGKSSPVGLLLLLLFFVAVIFLIRSMTKHLKRVPKSFDTENDAPEVVSGEQRSDDAEHSRPEGSENSGAAQAPVSPDGQRREDRDQ